jgi:hypothetical protein
MNEVRHAGRTRIGGSGSRRENGPPLVTGIEIGIGVDVAPATTSSNVSRRKNHP